MTADTHTPTAPETDDRVRPLLLAQAAKRDAMDWRDDDVEPVIAGLLLERDNLAAELDTLRASEARLREALALASNRLHRCSVDYDTGTHEFIETGEWAAEARAALQGETK